jgi:hypothetical protein
VVAVSLVVVRDPRELSETVERLLRDPAQRRAIGQRALSLVEEHAGAAQVYAERIGRLVESSFERVSP